MKVTDTERHQYNQLVAQMKFAIIAPVVANTYIHESETAYFKRVSEIPVTMPNGAKRKFSYKTYRYWLHLYRKGGFDALVPKTRLDYGDTRKLNDLSKTRIEELIIEFPKITGVMIHEKLIEEGLIKKEDASVDTVQRYIKKSGLRSTVTRTSHTRERRAWEFAHSCDGYEADTCHTFYIYDSDGTYRKTYLIAIIDNHSRVIVGARFFFSDNSANFHIVWKEAVIRYGRSSVMILDNGSTYRNKNSRLISARIGTQLIYCEPYKPQGKAVIERFFLTIKQRWLNADHGTNYHGIDSLNEKLAEWIGEYNRSPHTALRDDADDNHTPIQRYMYDMKGTEPCQLANKRPADYQEWVDECFLHEEKRRVNGDSTVVIKDVRFDVPSQYIGLNVIIRFDPATLETIYVHDPANKKRYDLKKTDRIENGKTRRTEIIY